MLKSYLLGAVAFTLSLSAFANEAFLEGVKDMDSGDIPAAIEHFKQATSEGHPIAPYSIGVMYEKGRGVTKDIAQAKVWYKKAAGKGHKGAQRRLKHIAQEEAAAAAMLESDPLDDGFPPEGVNIN